MSVYLPAGGKTYYYDFWWKGSRQRDTTHQTTKTEAELVEATVKLRLRQEAGGIAVFDIARTPTFQEWAEVFIDDQAKHVGRVDTITRTMSVLLEFWGRRPSREKKRAPGTNTHHVPAPYHQLRLGHPIADPTWITKFEAWVAARRVAGSTRNSYLSALSGLYKLARQPEYRQIANVPSNPFEDIRRSPPNRRLVALEPEQLIAWLRAAPHHVRIAMTIAALAPKLRLRTILALEWDRDVNRALTQITVATHKTSARTGLPQVTPIDPQLREILAALREQRTTPYVVPPYHGKGKKRPLKDIKKATRRAAEDAGLTWGVQTGVTFHVIRHSIATLLARLGIGERLRMEIMGHSEIRTTQQYTHLAAADQVAPHAQLSTALPLKETVLASIQAATPKPARGRRAAAVRARL